MIDHGGLWSRSAEFCDLKVEKCFMQLYQRAGMKLLGLIDHEGLWSKKEEFWRNKPMVIFRKNVYKRDVLPFSTKMYFPGKCL